MDARALRVVQVERVDHARFVEGRGEAIGEFAHVGDAAGVVVDAIVADGGAGAVGAVAGGAEGGVVADDLAVARSDGVRGVGEGAVVR